MNVKTLLGAAILGFAVLASTPTLAQTISNADIMKMDTNKDGRLDRSEYLAAMIKVFDAHAGAKGYCTPTEAMAVMKEIQDYSFLNKYNR